MTRKTLYVVWGENIAQGGIFDNQVVELLIALRERNEDVSLLVGLPVPAMTRSALLRQFEWRGINRPFDVAQQKLERLKAAGVPVHVRWLPFALSFYAKFWQLPSYHLGHIHYLRRLIRSNGIRILHCRSYQAALLASWANRGRDAKIIFDARGLFPEEGVLYRRLRTGGFSFRVWKTIERRLLETCAASVAVSEPFGAHFRSIAAQAHVEVIPTAARIEAFSPRVRGAGESTVVLAFLGTFHQRAGWYYSLRTLAQLVAASERAIGPTRLLMITQSTRQLLEPQLYAAGVRPDQLEITRSDDINETARLLSRADFGVYPFEPRLADSDDPILATLLGSKTGEYLAAGLPLIATAAASAVSQLIRARSVGICLSSANLAEPSAADLSALRALITTYAETQRRCLETAAEFSTRHLAARYQALYARLAGADASCT
jgi:glycosyltransferase involved in cell wall biosynthesis